MRALLAVLLFAPLAEAGAARARAGREVVHPEARFKMTVPAGWAQTLLGASELGDGASGAVFKSSPSARVTVIFYAAGNPHFKDAADYLARQTTALPVTPVEETTGPVEMAALGRMQGKRLARSNPDKKELVTAADGPGGFYAVTCAAAPGQWRRMEPLFKAALASFAALPARK